MSGQKIRLDSETMQRINKLRSEIGEEMDWEYTVEDIIEKAITALEDVRQG